MVGRISRMDVKKLDNGHGRMDQKDSWQDGCKGQIMDMVRNTNGIGRIMDVVEWIRNTNGRTDVKVG